MAPLSHSTPIPCTNGSTLSDFWQWAYSDLLSNTTRPIFAEYMVGLALGCLTSPRVEWDAIDLRYGGITVEVKSAAACQSWKQDRPSRIVFDIGAARGWDSVTGKTQAEAKRNADIYVFCHYPELDKSKANVLDIPAWDFYVVATHVLNRELPSSKSAALRTIRRLAPVCKYPELRATVDSVVQSDL